MTSLLERLRRRDWRLTPQRRAVATVLEGDHVHLTAEQVLAGARRIVPELSQATVYNTLNELVAMGELHEVRVRGTASQYDPNVGDGHHHLVCQACGMVYDVHPSGLDGVGLARAEQHGFSLGQLEVTFRGVCSACAERSPAPGGR
ncbi:MAG: Fur family transcriptional regulator [Acidimicrobiia bacterium]